MGPVECRRQLANDPANVAALQYLGIDLCGQGDGLGALRMLRRAHRVHGNDAFLQKQLASMLHVALNQITAMIQHGSIGEASAHLEWLSGFVPVTGHLARIWAMVRLIQARDAEAAELLVHAAPVLPADGGGIKVALDALDTHRRRNMVVGSVIIPAFRAADTIVQSLDSIVASLNHYRQETSTPDAKVQIIVVDDCSPDETADVVRQWGQAHSEQELTLIINSQNRGAGYSRNMGADVARGPYLWFLDADDYYLPPHFVVTAPLLDRNPQWDYVRTDMMFDGIDDKVSQVWRMASQNTYPCNLCIRRDAHMRTGGFADEPPFFPAVADDVAYSRAMTSLLSGALLSIKTVFYRMRPGNVLDRLQQDMISQRAPGDGQVPDSRFIAIELLIRRRIHGLDARRDGQAREQAELAAGLVARAGEHRRAGNHQQALDLLRRATAHAPTSATAWFDRGVTANQLSMQGEAKEAFARCVEHAPDIASARFNLGMLLLTEGAAAAALPHLRRAVELSPDNVSARLHLARAARRMGLRDEAEEQLLRALRLSPDNAHCLAEGVGILLDKGDAAAALAMGETAVRLAPGLYEAHAAHAAALEALARPTEALSAWDQAIACNPGYGEAFTGRALLLMSVEWGPPPPPRPAAAHAGQRIAITQLGRNGRFGNQILQYGVARLYAERHGLTLETPPWVGRYLFGLDDPMPGPSLPRVGEGEARLLEGLAEGVPATAAGHDIDGYFCGDVTALAPLADRFRQLFTSSDRWRVRAQQVNRALRSAGDTIVALHLRRGDFGWGPFWVAPEDWYLDWLSRIWPTLERPILYIATDDPACVPPFARYQPVTTAGLAMEPLKGAPFLCDFQALACADILAISNSTFSYAAGMLNSTAQQFYRPDRSVGRLVRYDPWKSPVLMG